MIDEPRDTAPPRGVYSRVLINLEKKSMMANHLGIVVESGFFLTVDNLARIFDDPLILPNASNGKHTPTLDAGVLSSDEWLLIAST